MKAQLTYNSQKAQTSTRCLALSSLDFALHTRHQTSHNSQCESPSQDTAEVTHGAFELRYILGTPQIDKRCIERIQALLTNLQPFVHLIGARPAE